MKTDSRSASSYITNKVTHQMHTLILLVANTQLSLWAILKKIRNQNVYKSYIVIIPAKYWNCTIVYDNTRR